MAPDSNGPWEEYRRMIISWHEDEVAERRVIKEALVKYQSENSEEHQEIMTKLTTILTERDNTRRWTGPTTAAIISAVVVGVAKALGF